MNGLLHSQCHHMSVCKQWSSVRVVLACCGVVRGCLCTLTQTCLCAVLRCGLKTVINLQRPGEHASCGNPLEQESGFTYRPETFMEAGSESLCPPSHTDWKVPDNRAQISKVWLQI